MLGCARKRDVVPKPIETLFTSVALGGKDAPPCDKPQIEGPLGVWRLAAGDYR